MNKILIIGIVTMLVITGVGVYYFYDDIVPGGSWSWELRPDDLTDVVFTAEQITCVGSNDPEDVCQSVLGFGKIVVFHYCEEDDDWSSWVEGHPWNSLEAIIPGETYQIGYDDYDGVLTLTIEKC